MEELLERRKKWDEKLAILLIKCPEAIMVKTIHQIVKYIEDIEINELVNTGG